MVFSQLNNKFLSELIVIFELFQNLKNQIMTTNLWVEQVKKFLRFYNFLVF